MLQALPNRLRLWMKQALAAAYFESLSCASQPLCPSMCLCTAHACSYIVVAISLCRSEEDHAVTVYAVVHMPSRIVLLLQPEGSPPCCHVMPLSSEHILLPLTYIQGFHTTSFACRQERRAESMRYVTSLIGVWQLLRLREQKPPWSVLNITFINMMCASLLAAFRVNSYVALQIQANAVCMCAYHIPPSDHGTAQSP